MTLQINVDALRGNLPQGRAFVRTVITLPNAMFCDMEIINWAQCDMMLVRKVIGLRDETNLDQLHYVLGKLRKMFAAHPKIDDATQRVRFLGYGLLVPRHRD